MTKIRTHTASAFGFRISSFSRSMRLVLAAFALVIAVPMTMGFGASFVTSGLAAEQASAFSSSASDSNLRWFNNRPIAPARTETFVVTAYSPDARSCGDSADGITASGYSVRTNGGFMVAADTRVLPFGTLLSIPGYDGGAAVPVLDRGGAIKGNRLDLLFPTHEEAMQWGVRTVEITIWDYADGRGNDFKTSHN